jgi:hypothetical protein
VLRREKPAEGIATVYDLESAVLRLGDRFQDTYTGTLEDYLRSFLAVISGCRDRVPTWSDAAEALAASFSALPAPFEDTWLAHTQPPPEEEAENTFEFLRRTLLFQIADLRRMRGGVLEDPHRGLGVSSPTGHTWYNFEPVLYLECAVTGAIAGVEHGQWAQWETRCDWIALAALLEMGRLYE